MMWLGSESLKTFLRNELLNAIKFYEDTLPKGLSEEDTMISRQGYAGLLWTKQFYEFIVRDWIRGDSEEAKAVGPRASGRNHDWPHVFALCIGFQIRLAPHF
ncbi:MAG: hypothetical protein ACKVJU_04265, partial [Verrucomicrobiales bacterium]